MSGFELSNKVDKNKVFLVNRSIIEKRLDTEYYLPKHYKLLNQLEKSSHSVLRFKNISKKNS